MALREHTELGGPSRVHRSSLSLSFTFQDPPFPQPAPLQGAALHRKGGFGIRPEREADHRQGLIGPLFSCPPRWSCPPRRSPRSRR